MTNNKIKKDARIHDLKTEEIDWINTPHGWIKNKNFKRYPLKEQKRLSIATKATIP